MTIAIRESNNPFIFRNRENIRYRKLTNPVTRTEPVISSISDRRIFENRRRKLYDSRSTFRQLSTFSKTEGLICDFRKTEIENRILTNENGRFRKPTRVTTTKPNPFFRRFSKIAHRIFGYRKSTKSLISP